MVASPEPGRAGRTVTSAVDGAADDEPTTYPTPVTARSAPSSTTVQWAAAVVPPKKSSRPDIVTSVRVGETVLAPLTYGPAVYIASTPPAGTERPSAAVIVPAAMVTLYAPPEVAAATVSVRRVAGEAAVGRSETGASTAVAPASRTRIVSGAETAGVSRPTSIVVGPSKRAPVMAGAAGSASAKVCASRRTPLAARRPANLSSYDVWAGGEYDTARGPSPVIAA